MRKFAMAVAALFACVGLVMAAEVTFVSYDKEKKELVVKDGDKETTYKVGDKVTFKMGDKDLESAKGIEMLEKWGGDEKAKGKRKLDVTAEKDELKEIKYTPRKKKADK